MVTSGKFVNQSNKVCVLLELITTRQMVVNQIISSIAMAGLANSHVLNAEGEKMQYILGALPGNTGPTATVDDVLAISESILGVMNAVKSGQTLLKGQLQDVLSCIDSTETN